MRKLLWVGDAVVATGFARCTHHCLDALRQSWDVSVLGLNYLGDPHAYPYPIYPCYPGGDLFGVGRVGRLVAELKPDVVVIQNDPWNIPAYVEQIRAVKNDARTRIVASLAVDGQNCRGDMLNGLDQAIFWTQFAAREARMGGHNGPQSVVPLGVDLKVYRPMLRQVSRAKIGLPNSLRDAFIVGNVNRNQPRKRLDLTVRYFAEWVNRHQIDNAYLYLQLCPTGDTGYDVQQLMKYYGFRGDRKRLILVTPDIGLGVDESLLPYVYSSFDVQVSTTQGEGWGLTTMEGMACGVPQVVPDWSALGEWASEAAMLIPCSSTCVTPNNINAIGGVPDEDAFVKALQSLYESRFWSEGAWSRCVLNGLALVGRPEYRWADIGRRFVQIMDTVARR